MAKRKDNKLIIGLVIAVVGLIAFATYKSRTKPKGIEVNLEKVEKRTIKETVSASGKVFPETEIKISSDVSGEIVDLLIEEGDSVQINQLLARIDPDAFLSQVERGEAGVNSAKARVANSRSGVARSEAQITQATAQMEQIEAQIVNAKAIHERNIPLFEDGTISKADFDNSKSNLDGLDANLRSAKANVNSAKANLEAAIQTVKAEEFSVKSSQASLKELKTSLRRTNIYAPATGVVSRLNVEQGERVVGTLQMAGTEMMRVANLDAIEVQVDVSENDVLRVSVGDPTEIEVDAYIDRKFNGVVTEIANSASNSASASLATDQVTNFVVKILINPDSYKDLMSTGKRFPFRPGMSASVEINTQTVENVLSIPIQAVTTREEKDKDDKDGTAKTVSNKEDEDELKEVVFLMSAGKAEMQEVKTGIQDDTYIQVLSGLTEGDELVTGPYTAVSRKLKDGKKIRKKKEKKKEEDEDEEEDD